MDNEKHFSKNSVSGTPTREFLEGLYERYNRRRYIPPDPLEFVLRYDDPLDQEVVGLIASALAYGRVAQIHQSVSKVLTRMGPSPRRFILEHSAGPFRVCFRGFKHRFTTDLQLASLLGSMRKVLEKYGSLEACFMDGLKPEDATVQNALNRFAGELREDMDCHDTMFIPSPNRGSACKRLHLFLRWMIRRDEVDPGVWTGIAPRLLLVPVDVHMHRIGSLLGFTRRKQADLQAAEEITEGFRRVAPKDPVRYDFALTRMGIHGKVPRTNGGRVTSATGQTGVVPFCVRAGGPMARATMEEHQTTEDVEMAECEIKLYALSTCSHCKSTKEYLKGCGVEYECIDVDKLEGEERKKIIEEVKQVNPNCSFPTLIIGDKVIVGFRQDEIKEALNL